MSAVNVPEVYNKEASIVAQNAGSTAAIIYAALTEKGAAFDADLYNEIRSVVFDGSINLGAAEKFIAYFASAVAQKGPSSFVSRRSGSSSAPSGESTGAGSKSPAEVELTFGKYRGKTIADVYDDDSSYVEWIAKEAQSDFIRRVAGEYLEQVRQGS